MRGLVELNGNKWTPELCVIRHIDIDTCCLITYKEKKRNDSCLFSSHYNTYFVYLFRFLLKRKILLIFQVTLLIYLFKKIIQY